MTDEDGFLRKLLENPADDTLRLVYADWREERDDEPSQAKAEFLRAQHHLRTMRGRKKDKVAVQARLRELARPLPTDWLALVSHLTLDNCPAARSGRVALTVTHINPPVRFDYECPKE